MLDLEPIKTREKAATPEPWEIETGGVGGSVGHIIFARVDEVDTKVIANIIIDRDYGVTPEDEGNAEFTANARQDVPDLIAEVERLQRGQAVSDALRAEVNTLEQALLPVETDDTHRLIEIVRILLAERVTDAR